MKKGIKKLWASFGTRVGFILLLIGLYWLKTMLAYHIDFDLGIERSFQELLAIVNPVPLAVFFIGSAFYFKKTKVFYGVAFFWYLILNILLISNALYYREFSDFLTISTILSASSVSAGLGDSALNLLRAWDIFYIFDFIIFIPLFWRKILTFDDRAIKKKASFSVTALATMLFSLNLFLAEVDRPQLLTRGFSNTYVVKYLGLPAFLGYNANQTYQNHKVRSEANPDELEDVVDYVKENYVAPNDKYFGLAKGKNVFMIHLESFQQFLIDYQLESDGQQYEVTPFINSLYHSKETFSFSNVFHQVKAGKTSDAETLMETSMYGLDQGSYFVQYGGDNTMQGAPHILDQLQGYTSAVFHGNTASFWNRNNTYKSLGYQYFIDQSYMSNMTSENSFQYGLNDKIFFQDSIGYLEHMQQPFYTKFITVSNHYPYQSLSGDELGFPLANTGDDTVNGYFATANYLDTSLKAFFEYLKSVDLYDNSIFILYGDHYGISDTRSPKLASLLGKDSVTWNSYDIAMLQRVPYMIHIPGMDQGFINDTYGGLIDNLPTLLHLLGIDTSDMIQLGQDLLAENRDELVALRTNNYYITPKYTSYGGKLYYTETGEEITNPDEATDTEVQEIAAAAKLRLRISDKVQKGDLLRFYTNSITEVDRSTISYLNALEQLEAIEKELGEDSTSVYSLNGNKSTVDKFSVKSYAELHKEEESSSSSTSGSDDSSSSDTSTESSTSASSSSSSSSNSSSSSSSSSSTTNQ